jgi:hypothetical protein
MSTVSSARSVCEMYGPWSRSFVNRVCTLSTSDSRSCASSVSVISSFALAMISPVSLLTTFCASVRPMMKSSGAVIFFSPAVSMSRMCFTVIRLSFATIVLPCLSLMSKRATSPRRRSGTTSNSTWLFSMWKVSKAKNSFRMRSGV